MLPSPPLLNGSAESLYCVFDNPITVFTMSTSQANLVPFLRYFCFPRIKLEAIVIKFSFFLEIGVSFFVLLLDAIYAIADVLFFVTSATEFSSASLLTSTLA